MFRKMHNDIIISFLLIIFSINIYISCLNIPKVARNPRAIESTIFPKIFAFLLIILCIIQIFSIVKKYKIKKIQNKKNNINKNFVFLLITSVFYTILLNVLGFNLTTFIYLFITIYFFDSNRKIFITFLISILITAVTNIMFSVIFNVFLPKGLLF